ncbi:UNVERIFIED_CONTAM: hypothetical protein Sradi_3201700 [Sesamum radiatum]|uniref:Uncharacterized protein n=1 Tax=Sesamum radiatum TaxID=300843 RepID=A0AAW2RFK8_SESRA
MKLRHGCFTSTQRGELKTQVKTTQDTSEDNSRRKTRHNSRYTRHKTRSRNKSKETQVQKVCYNKALQPRRFYVFLGTKSSSLDTKFQVAINTAGQSSTGCKIVDTTPSDGSTSVNPTEIKSKSTPFAILPTMMTDEVTMKEQLAQMAQAIANLQKLIEDKDLQIAQLTSNQEHIDVEEFHDSSKHASFSNHVENEKQVDKAPPMHDSMQKSTHSETSIATLSVQQLQEMITNTCQNSPRRNNPKLVCVFKAIYQTHQCLEDADGILATGTAIV